MTEFVAALLADLERSAELSGPDMSRALRRAGRLAELDAADQHSFLEAARERIAEPSSQADQLLAAAIQSVVQARRKAVASEGGDGSDQLVPAICGLYRALEPHWKASGGLLGWLASMGSAAAIDAFAELLVADPPAGDSEIAQAFSPLFRGTIDAGLLFPKLLAAMQHSELAAPVLDLANFVARNKLLDVHPAASRRQELIALLGELSQSLARLEEHPDEAGLSPAELSQRVEQSVALAVALCDALAQIGDPAAIGKLNQALELRHRRLRTEAAAALARLGDKRGEEVLLALAAEPVARLRVLAYAKELGVYERIAPELRTPQALAEAELTVYLAEPTQFGVPPSACELFDHRRQFWPGYNDPVDCYLLRFTYSVATDHGELSFSNIGIAGPVTHAFLADLGDLPPDDIYAAYAGWQAEHEEIREYDVARLSRSEKLEVERLVRRLHDAGYTEIEPQFMGYFFGDKALAAAASREGTAGVAVADFQTINFFPKRHSRRPLSARESYCIYKGRKLLRSFNRS